MDSSSFDYCRACVALYGSWSRSIGDGFPGILLTDAMIVIISIIAGNLKLAHTVNIETPRKNYQVQSNQPSS